MVRVVTRQGSGVQVAGTSSVTAGSKGPQVHHRKGVQNAAIPTALPQLRYPLLWRANVLLSCAKWKGHCGGTRQATHGGLMPLLMGMHAWWCFRQQKIAQQRAVLSVIGYHCKRTSLLCIGQVNHKDCWSGRVRMYVRCV